jgi:hypothetical protein
MSPTTPDADRVAVRARTAELRKRAMAAVRRARRACAESAAVHDRHARWMAAFRVWQHDVRDIFERYLAGRRGRVVGGVPGDPPPPGAAPAPPGGRLAVLGSLAEAEELLDRLERAGVRGADLFVLGDDRFAVRWPARR